ncbi:MAG: GAF domain-containing protein [bacterium]|nr:GAF domain-containing protein [bacterium]
MPDRQETPKPVPGVSPPEKISILLIGVGDETARALREADGYELMEAAELDQAWRRLSEGREIGVVCLGAALDGATARAFLETLYERLPEHRGVNLVFNAGRDLEIFHELLSEDRVFYLAQQPPPPSESAALVRNAARRYREASESSAGDEANGARDRKVLDLLRQLAFQEDLADIAELVVEAARESVSADRAYCLLHDPAREVLWDRDSNTFERRQESAAVGLVSFVLRSGLTVRHSRIGDDPRHDTEADDPLGTGRERFLAVPLSVDGDALGVLAAVREGAREDFENSDGERLERLATQVAPYLGSQLRGSFGQVGDAGQAPYDLGPFRRSMVRGLFQRSELPSGPLRLSPLWSRISYWVLVVALGAALIFSLVGEIDEYASGPAVVHLAGRTDLTALAEGTVTAVQVTAGQRVAAGQVLVRFHDAREAAELARIEREVKLQLINRLRDPADSDAGQALISRRAQRELARARIEERNLRAPTAGTVGDIWVRPGQYVHPGHPVLSLVGEESEPTLVVMIPGHFRPLLEPGMPIRLEISGYRYVYQHLEVGSIGDEVVGPAEVQRYLGPGISDSVALAGPIVIVRARLPSRTFEAEGRTYGYHDGMHGIAEVRVRSEKILLALVPALKKLLRDGDG